MPNISNISLNTSEALLPTAYSVQEITFTNHHGRKFDLRALVQEMSITESIYTPSLILSIGIKDPVNTLEEFQMTGQEKINVILARKDFGSYQEDRLDLNFIVSEYPIFGRFGKRFQVYTLRGVSQPAYASELTKISRSFRGDIRDFVKTILIKDLNIDPTNLIISERATAQVQFIVPTMTPIKAIYWSLRRAFDEAGAPFYFFQRLDGKFCLLSHSDLVEQEMYREYRDAKFFQYGQGGDTDRKKDYDERARRILTMASDIRMGKYGGIPNGAYASRTDYLDLSTKTVSHNDFQYLNEFEKMKWIEKNPVLSKNFHPTNKEDDLAKFTASKINYISKNQNAFDNGSNYHSTTENAGINKAQSYVENLDSMMHDLKLSGDFNLRSGQMIGISVPPAIDAGVDVKNSLVHYDIKRDSFLSGKYIVTGVKHNFAEIYTVDLKVKRDSFSFKLYEPFIPKLS